MNMRDLGHCGGGIKIGNVTLDTDTGRPVLIHEDGSSCAHPPPEPDAMQTIQRQGLRLPGVAPQDGPLSSDKAARVLDMAAEDVGLTRDETILFAMAQACTVVRRDQVLVIRLNPDVDVERYQRFVDDLRGNCEKYGIDAMVVVADEIAAADKPGQQIQLATVDEPSAPAYKDEELLGILRAERAAKEPLGDGADLHWEMNMAWWRRVRKWANQGRPDPSGLPEQQWTPQDGDILFGRPMRVSDTWDKPVLVISEAVQQPLSERLIDPRDD